MSSVLPQPDLLPGLNLVIVEMDPNFTYLGGVGGEPEFEFGFVGADELKVLLERLER